jgi:ATP-dependent RNA helicase DDX47/RRP3
VDVASYRTSSNPHIVLIQNPSTIFGLILVPNRELAYQVLQHFQALGSIINLRCAVIVGGMDSMSQAVTLSRKPHIIVIISEYQKKGDKLTSFQIVTPGRLLEHLENTKGFNLRTVKYLVLDEADRLLDFEFGPIITDCCKVFLLSAVHSYSPQQCRKRWLPSSEHCSQILSRS